MSLGYIYNDERKRQTVRTGTRRQTHTDTKRAFCYLGNSNSFPKIQFRTPSVAIMVSAKASQSSVRYAVNHHTKQQSPGNDCVTQFLTVLVSESCPKHGVQLLTRKKGLFLTEAARQASNR